MYHISDLKKYVRCPKLFWYSKRIQNEPFVRFVRLDESITDLIMQKLEIKDAFIGQQNEVKEVALEAISKYEWLVKARFEFGSLRIKSPIMHKTENGFDLYFMYSGHMPKGDDVPFYSNTVYVLQQNGIVINEIYVVHFNPDYIREEELDIQELFIISKHFYNDSNRPAKNIHNEVMKNLTDPTSKLVEMELIEIMDDVKCERQPKCTRRNKCRYYDLCFPQEKRIPDNSILHLASSQHKYAMIKNGIEYLHQVNLENNEGSRIQYAQIMAAKLGGLFVDNYALKAWMDDKIVQPLSFLDFEWETYAIPPYYGMKSYDVLVFQYSLHSIQEQKLVHDEFIGVEDCRIQLIEQLLAKLPKSGSILAYNADGAEKLRLLELAKQFPQYEQAILSICDRLVDLSFPFSAGLVYDLRMRGLYSLKVLLSIFDEKLTYQDLDIHHGMDAVFNWRMLDKDSELLNQDEVKNNLLKYCQMDTYAMVIVFNWLQKQIKGEIVQLQDSTI